MSIHTISFLLLVALPVLGTAAAEPPAAPAPAAAGMWVHLRTPVPDASKLCPDAEGAAAGAIKVALFSERSAGCPIASIDGQPAVTLAELAQALAAAHGGRGRDEHAGAMDPTAIANRLVNARLVVLEAEAMGIDELPEVKASLATSAESIGREILKEQVLRDVRADPAEVDRLFRDKVREYQLQSVLFPREDDAKAMVKQLKAGKKFDELASKAVAEKKAKGNDAGQFVHPRDLTPAVAGAVQKAKVGGTTAPLKVTGGWAVVEVEAVRYPENPQARAEAESIALVEAQKKALKAFYDAMVKKYAKVDEKLLKKLDFEAKKPGFEALKKDTRVIATVQGKDPVTVGLLATALGEQFYHGVSQATAGKKLNKAKGTTLDALLSARLVAVEVEARGIARTPEFQRRLDAARDSQLFGTFMTRVVLPNVKLDQQKVKEHYESHKADYALPAFYKTESIGFATQKDAELAVTKLRSGTDFKFLNANADGKLAPGKDTDRPLTVVSTKGMTPAFARAMDGAKAGDFRVYAAAPGQFYAVHVVQVTPPSVQPFEDVADAITKKMHTEAVQKSLDDWTGKLRKAHQVQVYLAKVGG